MNLLSIGILGLAIVACTGGGKPEKVLRDYISYRFQDKGQKKEKVLSFLDGPLKEQMEAMPVDKVESFNQDGKFKLTGFKVVKSRCSDDKCFATYIVKYNSFLDGKNEKSVESEIKELAELSLVEGNWKIYDVKNIKTFHESQTPLSVYGR